MVFALKTSNILMKLTPQLLLTSYQHGIFPMAQGEEIYWYDPDPRAIIPLDQFHVPRSLAQTIRQGKFQIRLDSDFRAVMTACAQPMPGRETTWINPKLIDLYDGLFKMGNAHTVEVWQADQLVGGLYGVAVNGLFAGESMFSRVRDGSKIALVHLVERLKAGGYVLLDTQFVTPHLQRFGAIEIPRTEYKERLKCAMTVQTDFFKLPLAGVES